MARSRCGVVLITGGIGPTDDDRTREALARVLDRPLIRDEAMSDRIRDGFAARGLSYSEEQARQADRPESTTWRMKAA